MTFFDDGDEDEDTKGDDNKASANPHQIGNLGDDIGERVGEGSDPIVSPL